MLNVFYWFVVLYVDEVMPLWSVSSVAEGGMAWDAAKVMCTSYTRTHAHNHARTHTSAAPFR